MQNWRPFVTAPLSSSELERILDDALWVLEHVGVECAHRAVAARLAEATGATCIGGRVRLPAANVRDRLERNRSLREVPCEGEISFTLGGCWAGLNYCDPETGEVRPASSDEAAQMTRLWDARGLSGVVPLVPGDVPQELVSLFAERLALINSRHLGGLLPVRDPEEVRFLIDMNLAAGRRYHLLEQVGISPLRFNSGGLEMALQFLDDPEVDVSLAGSIPIAGVTCPLDPKGALVQSVAEALAHDMLCSALGVRGGGIGLRIEPFDFRYSTIVLGSPEWCLYRVLVVQMTGHLTGSCPRGGMFRSTAKRPDAQAACERTASVLWQALLGARHFGAVGQLSVDEVFSPQQAVLDREILSYVERLIKGLDLEVAAEDPVSLIQEGVREASFVSLADTSSRFREFYWFPELFHHWNVGRWRVEGEPSVLREAWARAKEEIAESTFQLQEDQKKAIERIFEKAKRWAQTR